MSIIQKNFMILTHLCQDAKRENSELIETNRKLMRENKELRNGMESLIMKVNMLGEAALNLDREKALNKELTEKNNFLKLQIETVQKQLERKVKDNDELEIQVSPLLTFQLEMARADSDSFKKENNNLESEVRDYEKTNKTLNDQVDKLQHKYEKVLTSYTELKKKYEVTELERDNLK